MAVIARVQVEGSQWMVAVQAMPKMRQPDDGKGVPVQVFNSTTGEAMSVISLVEMFQDRAQVIKITVPTSGVPEGLTAGAQVVPVGLICSPWANKFGEQVNSGLSYRAESVGLLKAVGK
jgi:hypothetical protein